jgi:hypothetical protein
MAVRELVLLSAMFLSGCKGLSEVAAWCSDTEPPGTASEGTPTWHEDIEPLVRRKCLGCHTPGGLAPLDLSQPQVFADARFAVRDAVVSRRMPPFMAAPCCADYLDDRSLTADELLKVTRFIDEGLPPGDPARAPPRPTTQALLSRVDVTLTMPGAYEPKPPDGSTDDNRCFALEWPLSTTGFITGLSPRPGNRALVHHLIVAALDADAAAEARALDEADPLPGFDCNGGLGRFRGAVPLGGSLVGGDLPRGIGREVKPGGVVLLNIHYSVARVPGPETDLTAIDFKVDSTAVKADAIVMVNPAWLVSDGMKVLAGDPDAPFFYTARPHLFTGGQRVDLQGVSPHMHHFGKKLTVRVLKPDGTQKCLLEIPHWQFGWEQPYWFKKTIALEPDDRVYLECRFDNSDENQPFGRSPRDFAWGGDDQDMCAAFISYTAAP